MAPESDNQSTDLALVTNSAFVPRSLDDAEAMAKRLAQSILIPEHFRNSPANVFWAMALGADLGMSPAQALQAIYVVNGRPGMYADAMVAVVLASGVCHAFDCLESSPARAVFETRRLGRDGRPGAAQRKVVTIEDAERAGWTRNKKYATEPQRMLEARCKSWLARLVYPDVLRGMSAVEDLEVIDAEVISEQTYVRPPTPSNGTAVDPVPPTTTTSAAPPDVAPRPEPEPPTAHDDVIESSPPTAEDLDAELNEAQGIDGVAAVLERKPIADLNLTEICALFVAGDNRPDLHARVARDWPKGVAEYADDRQRLLDAFKAGESARGARFRRGDA